MNSVVTDDVLACFAAMPAEVRELARRAYRTWRANPSHPGLRFKPIRGHDGLGWRALGRLDAGTVTRFWIGSHADYEGLIG